MRCTIKNQYKKSVLTIWITTTFTKNYEISVRYAFLCWFFDSVFDCVWRNLILNLSVYDVIWLKRFCHANYWRELYRHRKACCYVIMRETSVRDIPNFLCLWNLFLILFKSDDTVRKMSCDFPWYFMKADDSSLLCSLFISIT